MILYAKNVNWVGIVFFYKKGDILNVSLESLIWKEKIIRKDG